MCEVFERRFSLINSSHRYSTQPNYRSTPNYPTKTKARVPLSLFVALRLFSRADTRSGVHITRFSQKSKNVRVQNVLAKNVRVCVFSLIYLLCSFSPIKVIYLLCSFIFEHSKLVAYFLSIVSQPCPFFFLFVCLLLLLIFSSVFAMMKN